MKSIEEWEVWEVADISGPDFKLFYKRNEPIGDITDTGFKFKFLKWVMDCNQGLLRYELICHGYGYFDGIRHLWFGQSEDESFGYMNYPDLEILSLLFRKLSDLQLKFCDEDSL